MKINVKKCILKVLESCYSAFTLLVFVAGSGVSRLLGLS